MPPTTCTGYCVVLALEKMANYGYGVSRTRQYADLCKIPHNYPFSRLMTPNLFSYFLLLWPSSSEPFLDLQSYLWEWRWRCPTEKGSRMQLFSALFPSPLQVNPSIFSLLSFLLLTWCFYEAIVITPECITAFVTMLPLHRFSWGTLPQLAPTAPPAPLTTLNLTILSSSSCPSQDRGAGSCS